CRAGGRRDASHVYRAAAPDTENGSVREYLRSHGLALAPEEVAELQAAFNAAWEELLADRASSRYKPDGELRARLGKQIFELRDQGEREPNRVAALAIMLIKSPRARP